MEKYIEDNKNAIYNLFMNFHYGKITKDSFVFKLKTLDKKTKRKDKSIWFRFFKNDTLATTPSNIIRSLDTIPNCYQNNRAHILESIGIAVTKNSLQIHYS